MYQIKADDAYLEPSQTLSAFIRKLFVALTRPLFS